MCHDQVCSQSLDSAGSNEFQVSFNVSLYSQMGLAFTCHRVSCIHNARSRLQLRASCKVYSFSTTISHNFANYWLKLEKIWYSIQYELQHNAIICVNVCLVLLIFISVSVFGIKPKVGVTQTIFFFLTVGSVSQNIGQNKLVA